MKKFLLSLFVALMLPGALLAQQYPSPTLNNATVTGTLTTKNTVPSANNSFALGSNSFKWSDLFASKAHVGASGWLEPIVPITESISTFQGLSDAGIYGVLGASKSDANAVPGAMSSIGGGFYGINNNTVSVQSGYGIYAEGRRYPGAGSTGGIESATINRGSNIAVSPYTPIATGQNGSFWASCGRPDVADSANCSYAYGLFNAGPAQNSPFNTGILFASNSISGTDKAAIDMPERYNLVWRNSSNANVSAGVRSNISNTTTTLALSFENAGAEMQQPIGTMISRFASTAVTFTPPLFTNAINSTSISATGSVSATTTVSANVGFTGPAISGVAVGPGAGTGGSVGAVCAGGHVCTQSSGQVQVTTGASGTAAGRIATVTFANARTNAPNCVVTGYNNAVTTNINAMPATSATTLEIHVPSALTTGTVYQINYVCGGA